MQPIDVQRVWIVFRVYLKAAGTPDFALNGITAELTVSDSPGLYQKNFPLLLKGEF
jgi:hypothetical protein